MTLVSTRLVIQIEPKLILSFEGPSCVRGAELRGILKTFIPRFSRFESSPIYTIRVDSFADSDGDGIGDLDGLIDKLGYIKNDISIGAIALEGLLEKSDPSVIQNRLGIDADFKKLAAQIKVTNLPRDIPSRKCIFPCRSLPSREPCHEYCGQDLWRVGTGRIASYHNQRLP